MFTYDVTSSVCHKMHVVMIAAVRFVHIRTVPTVCYGAFTMRHSRQANRVALVLRCYLRATVIVQERPRTKAYTEVDTE